MHNRLIFKKFLLIKSPAISHINIFNSLRFVEQEDKIFVVMF